MSAEEIKGAIDGVGEIDGGVVEYLDKRRINGIRREKRREFFSVATPLRHHHWGGWSPC